MSRFCHDVFTQVFMHDVMHFVTQVFAHTRMRALRGASALPSALAHYLLRVPARMRGYMQILARHGYIDLVVGQRIHGIV